MKTFRSLVRMVMPYWQMMWAAVLLGSLTVLSNTALIGTSAFLISMAALQPSIASLQVVIVGVRFFGISRGVFRYLERLVSHKVNFQVLAAFRVWFYQKIEPIAPAGLGSHRGGDLLKRAVGDIESLQDFYIRVLAAPLVAVFSGVWVLLYVGWKGVDLALILLAAYLMIGGVLPIFIYWLSKRPLKRLSANKANLSAEVVEGLQGIPDILAYQQEGESLRRVSRYIRGTADEEIKLGIVQALQNGLSVLLSNLGVWFLLLAVIPMVESVWLRGVELAVIALGAMASFEAVAPLPLTAEHLRVSLEAGQRLFEVGREGQKERRYGKKEVLGDKDFDIRFKNVSFSYPEDDWGLRDINLGLQQGRKTAVVGVSGAGKTTMVNLLLKFWEVDKGEIEVGGMNIQMIDSDWFRKNLAVISQDVYMFNDTIGNNLRLGNPAASDLDLMAAMEEVRMGDFVRALPEGLDTWVGEHGMALSAGQRQRIAIARALLKDAPVLILDEPTANLDAVTERDIFEMIFRLWEEKSILLITHRLRGLEGMDEVVVLDDGRIISRGKYDELAAKDEWFREMGELQKSVFDFG